MLKLMLYERTNACCIQGVMSNEQMCFCVVFATLCIKLCKINVFITECVYFELFQIYFWTLGYGYTTTEK